MPLFEVAFPDLSKAVIDQLIIIATFDLLPAADLMIKVSGEEPVELEDDNRFVKVGYDFEEFIMNLGTLFITLLVILMMFLSYWTLMSFLKHLRIQQRDFQKLRNPPQNTW